MGLDIYWIPSPAEGRAIFMLCRAIGLEVNMKMVDTMKNEQESPDFIKMNPLHTVPTLDDNGFYLWESRSILRYLANKYDKEHKLYPEDVEKRAKADMFLDYDLGSVSSAMIDWVKPQAFCGEEPKAESTAKMKKVLTELETCFLSKNKFLLGENLSIADLAIVASVSYLEMVGFDFLPWPCINDWFTRCKQLPYYKECNKGLYEFIEMKKAGNV